MTASVSTAAAPAPAAPPAPPPLAELAAGDLRDSVTRPFRRLLANLPVSEPDPVRRLDLIQRGPAELTEEPSWTG